MFKDACTESDIMFLNSGGASGTIDALSIQRFYKIVFYNF